MFDHEMTDMSSWLTISFDVLRWNSRQYCDHRKSLFASLRQYCFAKICNIAIIFIRLGQVFLPDAHLFLKNGRRKWPQWLLYPHLPASPSQPIHRFGAQNNSDSCRQRHAASTSSGDGTRRSQPSSFNFTKGGHGVSSTMICVSLILTAGSYHHHVCRRE